MTLYTELVSYVCRIKQGRKALALWGTNWYHRIYDATEEVSYKPMSLWQSSTVSSLSSLQDLNPSNPFRACAKYSDRCASIYHASGASNWESLCEIIWKYLKCKQYQIEMSFVIYDAGLLGCIAVLVPVCEGCVVQTANGVFKTYLLCSESLRVRSFSKQASLNSPVSATNHHKCKFLQDFKHFTKNRSFFIEQPP
jgi:hypothetical protein